tara:strand:+ start:1535 stop:1783 length:249 start_codon:yes stop_codon:yes gene_type:complete
VGWTKTSKDIHPLETFEIIMVGYGVALLYLVWETLQTQKQVHSNTDVIDEIISKHNKLAEEMGEFFDSVEDEFRELERKNNG